MRTPRTLNPMATAGADFRHWYDNLPPFIAERAEHYGVDPNRYAAVLAITSARTMVKTNLDLTERYFRDGTQPWLPTHQIGLAHYLATGEVRGPKIGPFYEALMGSKTALVMDTWMLKALKVPRLNKGVLRKARKRVAKVAASHEWNIPQTQAAIWATTIRQHNRTPGVYRVR